MKKEPRLQGSRESPANALLPSGATSSLGQAAKHQSQDRQKLLRAAHFQCGAGARQVFEHFQKVAGSTYRKAICPHVYCSFIFSALMGVPVEYPPVGMFSGGMTVFLKREVPAVRIEHPPSADACQCKPYGGHFVSLLAFPPVQAPGTGCGHVSSESLQSGLPQAPTGGQAPGGREKRSHLGKSPQ